ncbi:hypothetical protein pEaSNUABM3_00060 [Erwinia phage pEa_SNUABM_3]|uniref:Uncharacterized protein n=1 Tax=Erwinia phage pEa_SNUABM_3 TaxID=2869552 RepID=A0AAE7XHR4_9CAUD|nr:hypothetical protein MPK68_gp060 [Erwinia phage pEa_SNUABM_3]QZE56257.1 hypothetical protein pEaSNUABM3_00060 [Erwinia phage pEa_SNUABM_3]
MVAVQATAVEEVPVIKRFLNWIGLMLISDKNKRKLRQHEAMMRACTDVYDWCGADLPQTAEAVEYVRTRALGYENRLNIHNGKIMTPYECHTGISDWRDAMRRKYRELPELDFDGKDFKVKSVSVN